MNLRIDLLIQEAVIRRPQLVDLHAIYEEALEIYISRSLVLEWR